MRFLRTNTAIRLTVGPFFDKTDGVTPETSLTVTSCKLTLMADIANVPTLQLDANATASYGNNDMVHVTGDDAGFYDLELTATNLNFLGRAMLAITDAATHCPVFHEFMVLPAMVYDSIVLGTDRFDTNVTHINDVAATSVTTIAAVLGTTSAPTITSGRVNADLTHIATAAVSTSTAQLGVNVVNFGGSAGSFTSGRPAVNASYIGGVPVTATTSITFPSTCTVATTTGAVGSVTGAVGSVTGAVGSVTGAVGSVTGAVGSVTGNVGGNVTGSVGSIATGGIAAASFAAGAIDAAAIATGAITNAKFAAGAIDAAAIADNAIDAGALAADCITNAKIADNAIAVENIANDAITAAKIAAGAIDAATFAADVDAEVLAWIVDDATRIDASALNTASVTTIPDILADTAEIGAAGAGLTALGDTRLANLDAAISTRSTLTQTQVTGGAYAINSASFAFNAALDFTTTQKAATLARVTLVDTTTTNTDMRGTDNAALAATALSTVQWTNARAGYLDNINNSTLATASFPTDPADQSLIISATNTILADTNAILIDTAEIGAAGAGLTALATAANLATVLADTNELQTDWADGGRLDLILDARASQTSVDDLPTNAELATSQASADDATLAAIAALNNLSAAQVNAEVDAAIETYHLDHLLAVTYDPASKPGAADALFNELVESDAGVARYTANALEQAPTGGSAPTVEQIADEVQTRTIAAVTTVATTTNLTNLPTIPANWLTAAGTAADFTTEIQTGLATAASIAALNNLSAAQVNAEVDTALADYDGPTNAEMVARTPSATAIANVETVFNTDFASNYNTTVDAWNVSLLYWKGDSMANAVAGSAPAHVYTMADNVITAAKIADGAIDTATFASGATLPRVTLVDTTTTNTDMRGTDNAALAATALSTVQWTNTLATNLGTTNTTVASNLDAAVSSRSTLTQTQVTGGAYSIQSSSCVLGDSRIANLDAAVSSRSTYAGGAVASVTGNVGGNVTGTVGGIAGTITTLDALDTAQDSQHATTQAAIADVPTNAELATALGTADDATLAQIALVKAKTDLIPASPAAVSDIPTAAENATAWGARVLGNSRTADMFLQGLTNRIEFAADGLSFTVYATDDTTSLATGAATRLADDVGGLRSVNPT